MNNTPIPKHESTIEFEIKKVKEAVLKFAEINTATDFTIKEKNDIFGSYVFSIFKKNSWNGFSSGTMNITLNELENNKTKISVETFNTSQNHYVNVRDLTQAQSDFLQSMSKILSGDFTPQLIKVEQGTGCLGLLALLITSTIFTISLINIL